MMRAFRIKKEWGEAIGFWLLYLRNKFFYQIDYKTIDRLQIDWLLNTNWLTTKLLTDYKLNDYKIIDWLQTD
jgi:hypothetical protein